MVYWNGDGTIMTLFYSHLYNTSHISGLNFNFPMEYSMWLLIWTFETRNTFLHRNTSATYNQEYMAIIFTHESIAYNSTQQNIGYEPTLICFG